MEQCLIWFFSTESNLILSTESAGTLGSSDHDMIIVHTQLNCEGKRFTKTTRNWQKANIDAMKKDLNDVNWDTLLQDKDSQQSWDVFQGVLDRSCTTTQDN